MLGILLECQNVWILIRHDIIIIINMQVQGHHPQQRDQALGCMHSRSCLLRLLAIMAYKNLVDFLLLLKVYLSLKELFNVDIYSN